MHPTVPVGISKAGTPETSKAAAFVNWHSFKSETGLLHGDIQVISDGLYKKLYLQSQYYQP